MLATVAGGSSIEPIAIEFEEKPVEEVYKESMENIESKTLWLLLLNMENIESKTLQSLLFNIIT